MRRVAVFLATSAGAGFVPFAPGTVGSAVGVVVYVLTCRLSPWAQAAIVVGISIVGVWAAGEAARHFHRDDPSQVVIDEVAGQLVTLFLTGVGWLGALAGFLLFRLFDVVKPWPARRFESLPGGLGIMADDWMAGVYGWLALQAAIRFLPGSW